MIDLPTTTNVSDGSSSSLDAYCQTHFFLEVVLKLIPMRILRFGVPLFLGFLLALYFYRKPAPPVPSRAKQPFAFNGEFAGKSLKSLHFETLTGQVTFEYVPSQKTLDYECKAEDRLTQDPPEKRILQKASGEILFAWDDFTGLDCTVKLPKLKALGVRIKNGSLRFRQIPYEVKGELTNGQISFKPDAKTKYFVEAFTQNGSVSGYPNIRQTASKQSGISLKLNLKNGNIHFEEK